MDSVVIFRQLTNDALISLKKDLDLVMKERELVVYDEHMPLERTRLTTRARNILTKQLIFTVGQFKACNLEDVIKKNKEHW